MNRGIKYILLSTLCFAFVNIGVKALSNPSYFGFQKFPAHEIVFFRSIITFIISYFLLKKQGKPILGYNRKWLLIRGIFGTLALTLFFFTLQNLDLSIATVVQYLSPIFTLLLSVYLFKERINSKQWFMVLVAFVGVLLIGYYKLQSANTQLVWLGIGILSAIFSGVAYNAIIKCRETDSALNVVIYFPMIATPIMLVWCLFDYVAPSFNELLVIIFIGVMTQFAQVFMTKALQNGNSSEVIPFKYLGAIYAVIIGYLVFDERLQVLSGIGILLILVGVIGSQMLGEKSRALLRKGGTYLGNKFKREKQSP